MPRRPGSGARRPDTTEREPPASTGAAGGRRGPGRADPPGRASLAELREAAARCRACGLWRRATQTVFGEGPAGAGLMLVGEQPGDREDRGGRPFVGPAGALLERALAEAGVDREDAFVTNAVKHFKWRPGSGGKKRIHEKPSRLEVGACLPWLEAELAAVRPRVVVCLGATAAQALLGSAFRVTRDRGRVLPSRVGGAAVLATVHPSAVLRARSDADRRSQYRELVADLEVAARALGAGSRGGDVSGRRAAGTPSSNERRTTRKGG